MSQMQQDETKRVNVFLCLLSVFAFTKASQMTEDAVNVKVREDAYLPEYIL